MRRNVLSRNRLLICFAFGFALALGFIGFQKMLKTSAVHSAYNGFDAGNIISDFVSQ